MDRDLVGCFCILEKVGMLCLEHYIPRIVVIWIEKRKREARVEWYAPPFVLQVFTLGKKFDWIKLFIGITLCFQKDSECCIRGRLQHIIRTYKVRKDL